MGGAIPKSFRPKTHISTKLEIQPAAPAAKAGRLTLSILVATLILTPLAILPARFETYDTAPKVAVLAVGLGLLLWFRKGWSPGVVALWSTRMGRWFFWLLGFGVASLLISAALSNDLRLAMAGTVWRRLGAVNQVIAFLFAAALGSYVYLHRSRLKTLLIAMEAGGAITSLYAILQYAGWDPLIPSKMYTDKLDAIRPPATLTHATYFATFLAGAILITAGLRLRETSRRWKRAHEGVLILLMAALALTGTRSALIGLFFGACILGYFERKIVFERKHIPVAGIFGVACLAVASLFLALPASKGVRARLAEWVSERAGGPRLLVWHDSLPIVWRHAVAGVGPEFFEPEFRSAESLELARAYPDSYFESPHNFFLEFAVSQGIPGLAGWVALLALACYCGVKGQRRTASLFGALVAMLISLQFCPLTLTNELYLLVLIAMLVTSAAPDVVPASRVAASAPILTALSRAAAVLLVLFGSAHLLQAGAYSMIEDRLYRADLASAESWYSVARYVPMPGPDLSLSRQAAAQAARFSGASRAGAFALAAEAAEAAELDTAERFNAFYQAGTLAILRRDLPAAENSLRAATDAAPTWYRARMALACVLWWQGRNEEAQLETDRAVSSAGVLEASVKRTTDGARAQVSALAALRRR